jgi:3-dehydroquinate synthase
VTVATIRLHLPTAAPAGEDRSYDISVGHGLLNAVGPTVHAAGGRRAVVIADAAVAATHAAVVRASLQACGVDVATLIVPSGEGSKSIVQAGRLWDTLAEQAVDRRTHVVAVGGGVVGDLAGFVAATFGRGLACWQVPTTVVAQVDSAIGGKTGINLSGGKNLVGAFWQPAGVVADIDTLATLPAREFVSGFAEVVKYGMILDAAFFTWLEGNVGPLLAREPAAMTHAVERSAALKAGVVERDERAHRPAGRAQLRPHVRPRLRNGGGLRHAPARRGRGHRHGPGGPPGPGYGADFGGRRRPARPAPSRPRAPDRAAPRGPPAGRRTAGHHGP